MAQRAHVTPRDWYVLKLDELLISVARSQRRVHLRLLGRRQSWPVDEACACGMDSGGK